MTMIDSSDSGKSGAGQGNPPGAGTNTPGSPDAGAYPPVTGASANPLTAPSGDVGAMMRNLPTEQLKVLEALLTGMNISDVARQSGVARFTIYRWLKHNTVFQAAYSQWKDELRQSAQSRLLSLAEVAVDVMDQALRAGDDPKLSFQLLKGLGIIAKPEPKLIDPVELQEAELERHRRAARVKIEMQKLKAEGL